jgi:hypothetical protein
MQRVALIFFVAFELCYYLLIAQTGIVEYFNSDMLAIGTLPIGGVLGALFVMFSKFSKRDLLIALLSTQTLLTLFYPEFTPLMLFVLGFSVGGIAPILVNTLKLQQSFEMGISLAIAYSVGTALFTTDPASRQGMALIFSIVALLSVQFLPNVKVSNYTQSSRSYFSYSMLGMMTLWVFLDSALFETLSRDFYIPIWRGGFSIEIALFHILGVIAAFYINLGKNQKELLILSLFSLSYLLFFLQEALLLSIVYPFVISYYNVVILQNLTKVEEFKMIAISMIFIGWIASGAGLLVALENLIIFVPIVFLGAIIYMINSQIKLKEIHYV